MILAAAFVIVRLLPILRRGTIKPAVAAMLLVGALFMTTGCEGALGLSGYVSNEPALERVEYKLAVEKDSMAVTCTLKVCAPKPASARRLTSG